MSAINEPHPDAATDDAAAFFGAEEEATSPDPAALNQSPGPAAFNPESGDFGKPTEEASAPSDPRTAEERREDAYQYATGHDEPVSEEMQRAHDEYVALQERANELEAQQDTALPAPEPVEPVVYEAQEQQAKLRAIAQKEAAAAAATSEPDPPPGAEADPAQEAPSQPAAEGETGGDGSAEEKARGTVDREYIVFSRLVLTEPVLKELLRRIDAGEQPEPMAVWREVDRAQARNVNGAVGTAYTKHQKTLGEKADLAAVSSRSFQIKHVEPKQVVETNLTIT
jgi:hypothetical protein